MLAKTYAAFKAAGTPEADAQAAAEELADYENRLSSIEARLGCVESKLDALASSVNTRFSLLTWAVGINAAATIAIFGLLLHR